MTGTKLEKLVYLNIGRDHKQFKASRCFESLIGVVGPREKQAKREKCHLFFFKVGD